MARAAQQAGKQFEMMIEQANNVYRLKNKALIFKSEPSIKTMRDHEGAFKTPTYAKSNGLDYSGTLAGGRGVFFEAKQTAAVSFPLKQIKPHQIETFRMYEKLDALSFLLVRFSKTGKVFLLPPRTVIDLYDDWKKSKERASIPLATFEAHGTEIAATNGCAVDWLDAVRRKMA